MPAFRSRTENWRQNLENIHERNGALEITLAANTDPDTGAPSSSALIWRVRIIGLNDHEITVEEPMALGRVIPLEAGTQLVCIIVVGQNRWMFRTDVLGRADVALNGARSVHGIRLRMPADVERCQRRNFYRVSTVGIDLPRVEMYPLLDPASSGLAEAANRVEISDASSGVSAEPAAATVQPEVGPRINALLMNVGGGGVGLMLEPEDRASVEGRHLFWLRIALTPHIPRPLGVTARLRHLHIDSTQKAYAGMAFDFGGRAEHEKFVVDQLCRFVAQVQREQRHRPNAA